MSKTIIAILFMLLFAIGIQADQLKQAELMPDHIKADLALLQSVEAFSQAQASQALLAGFVTVGDDLDPNFCNFRTIQAAIDDAVRLGITEIRVAYNKTYYENLKIDDISISLIGGYASCQAARVPFSSPNSNQVSINGGRKGPVVEIKGASQRNTILFKNLRLRNGAGLPVLPEGSTNYILYGGGIFSNRANALVTLMNVDVRENLAHRGGGIAILDRDTDMLLLDSRVLLNSAERGGGIYCSGFSSSIVVAKNSGVIANEASRRGGGVNLFHCNLSLYSGTATAGAVGISANRAELQGGGVYANGASVTLNGQQYCTANGTCLGDNTNPASIRGNTAGFEPQFDPHIGYAGGGIAALFDSTVTINAGYFEGNTGSFGGGIFLDFSNLTVKRIAKTCWDNQRCNLFLGNRSERDGGVVYARNSNIDISAGFFEHNDAPQGSVISSFGEFDSQSFTRIEGSVFDHNGSSTSASVFRVVGENGLEIVHSTIADNTIANFDYAAIFRMRLHTGLVPSLDIHSSILDNPGFENLNHNMSNYGATFSCIITNDVVTLSAENEVNNPIENLAGGARILNTNPGFANRANKNYKLVAGAAAIDYCHTPTYAEVKFKDIEFQDRGVDDSNHTDNYFLSFYDIGADEAYFGPLIFKNSFE